MIIGELFFSKKALQSFRRQPLYFVFKYLTKATFSSKIQFLRKSCLNLCQFYTIMTNQSKLGLF